MLSPTSWEKLLRLYGQLGIHQHPDIRRIGGLGGGTAIDQAKVTAKAMRYDCVAIPSMLSTDVFATNKSAVVIGAKKVTVDSVLPSLVIVDEQYLKLSEKENRYGVADILSISTALMDWALAVKAGNDTVDRDIWARAASVLDHMLVIPPAEVNDRLTDVLLLVAEAGYITNDYGSGRPESGSEHIFASAIELRQAMHHGAAVSLGIMIMTRAHGVSAFCTNTTVENYLDGLGMIDVLNELRIPRALVLDILQHLEPRKGRYTIVNESRWRSNIGEILDDLPVTLA